MALDITQLILSIILIVLVLLQGKGSSLGGIFGGSGALYQTKRGAEKIIHRITILCSVAFFILALVNILY
ncbi:MAG: Uncharacterized protein G01um101418_191 [Parcubacteria group bacterium Gr01-1014_18]|nr:MAG: Uncharacterized protein Greene041636_159 [Parcubacteria group bacterium Greene0416_36]TSC81351.1 MAG: Uncharacterized protein G01um101418_191 [Parcubacteria group bacterium Gr01-1014_18]TSC99463.1 MAG: Uncharacterized protein Greene101420_130 [Parcubacteria group bacterium Greene1014_20]TSD07618.1 MAG: Uncharacterized protein Greene07142_75 [Parcubacteria group bacterium Greene0714_2]